MNTVSLEWFLAGFWAYWCGGKSVVTGSRSSQHMKRPGFLNGGGFRPRKEQS